MAKKFLAGKPINSSYLTQAKIAIWLFTKIESGSKILLPFFKRILDQKKPKYIKTFWQAVNDYDKLLALQRVKDQKAFQKQLEFMINRYAREITYESY